MDLKKAQQASLKHARAFAQSGNATWAQLWLDQAHSYLEVSKRQVKTLNRLLEEARKRKEQDR